MIIKPLILEMMARDLPEFRLVDSPKIFYVFRRKSQRDLFDYIKYQRDGKTGALALDIATTYDPNWNLYPAGPLGVDCPLISYKKRKRIKECSVYPALEPWYNYHNDKNEFQTVLLAISKDLTDFGLKFFREAANILESDKQLQHGLKLIRERGFLSNNDLAAFQKDILDSNYRPWDNNNEHLNDLKQKLESYTKNNNLSKEQHHPIPALVIALMCLQRDKLV